jgi:hypothetical protein
VILVWALAKPERAARAAADAKRSLVDGIDATFFFINPIEKQELVNFETAFFG